jgi:hypothetical protein
MRHASLPYANRLALSPARRRRAHRATALAAMLAALAAVAAARPAAAVICSIDSVPAATLLLPYFEVDLSDPNGLTTLFTIANSVAAPVLTHVEIWSDLAVPILGFNVYLTGYDVQSINLRDVVISGKLPQTAGDPAYSPRGPLSESTNFPGCANQLPLPPLPASFIQHQQLALTGQPSPLLDNMCAGQNIGDNIARGYITVDTVSNCTLRAPDDSGYFGAGGTGDATNQNVLWGTWFIVNSAQSYLIGSNMVAIEADATNPATSTIGNYTFYGRYVGWSAADNREPLTTHYAAQYFGGGNLFVAGTDMIVWRDTKIAQQPFHCPAVPPNAGLPWYPLGQEGAVIFDEQENPLSVQTVPTSPQPPTSNPLFFVAAAQRALVNSAALPVPYAAGWMDIDLNATLTGQAVPPADPAAAQGYVISAHIANGHAAAVDAFRLDSACSASHAVPGKP